MLAALLEVEGYLSVCRRVLGSVGQQVEQDMRHVFLVDECIQLRSVDGQRDTALDQGTYLFHQLFAEGMHRRVLQLDVVG